MREVKNASPIPRLLYFISCSVLFFLNIIPFKGDESEKDLFKNLLYKWSRISKSCSLVLEEQI